MGSEFSSVAATLSSSDDESSRSFEVFSLGSTELNITDPHSISAAVTQHKPDLIINAAAYTAVDKAETESDLAYAINRDGVANLAICCKQFDIPLIHLSTDYVFDGNSDKPYSEADTPNPQGVYGASKLAGERALTEHWHKHIIVRVSWVFGKQGNNFVKTMLRLAAGHDELSIVADQWGAPTAARSIAENLLHCATRCHEQPADMIWGTYHLPSSPFTSWHGFANVILDKAHNASLLAKVPTVKPISTKEYPTPAKRPANSRLVTEPKNLGMLTPCDWQKELDDVLRDIPKREA